MDVPAAFPSDKRLGNDNMGDTCCVYTDCSDGLSLESWLRRSEGRRSADSTAESKGIQDSRSLPTFSCSWAKVIDPFLHPWPTRWMLCPEQSRPNFGRLDEQFDGLVRFALSSLGPRSESIQLLLRIRHLIRHEVFRAKSTVVSPHFAAKSKSPLANLTFVPLFNFSAHIRDRFRRGPRYCWITPKTFREFQYFII